jgi:hypothetical protein
MSSKYCGPLPVAIHNQAGFHVVIPVALVFLYCEYAKVSFPLSFFLSFPSAGITGLTNTLDSEIFFFLFFFFCDTRVQIQGLHLEPLHQPFSVKVFFSR